MKYSEVFPPVTYGPAERFTLPRELFERAGDEGWLPLEGWQECAVEKDENMYDLAARHGVYPQRVIDMNFHLWFDTRVFYCELLRLPVVVESDPPIEPPEGYVPPEPRKREPMRKTRDD